VEEDNRRRKTGMLVCKEGKNTRWMEDKRRGVQEMEGRTYGGRLHMEEN
jgi:hypothetical protein